MSTTMYVPSYAYDEDLPDNEQSEMLDESAVEELYDEMLNDCYPPVTFGDLEYLPSRVLGEVDPVAYRCGLIDYMDSDFVEIEVD